MLRIIIISFFLFLECYSQLKDFEYLPVQDSSQSLKESVPIYITDSLFLILYLNPNLDTLYCTRTFDGGKNWEVPKFIKVVTHAISQKTIYLTALKTQNGRILVCWYNANQGMNIFYSDDNGSSWSDNQVVVTLGLNNLNRLQHFNVSQLNDSRIVLSFNHELIINNIYYKISHDNGETFSDSLYTVGFPSLFHIVDCSILSNEENHLLCIVKGKSYINNAFDIFMKRSTNNGASWSDTAGIVYSSKNEIELAVNKDKFGKISLFYVREDTIKFIDTDYSSSTQKYMVCDIYCTQSIDFGNTWSSEKKVTKYIGDDKFVGLSTNNEKNLLTYSSNKITNDFQIFYGIADESEELYHPPKLFYFYPKPIENQDKKFLMRAYVKDDEAFPKVTFSIKNSNIAAQLFDEGNHDDLRAGDGIFANVIDIPEEILQSQFVLDVNKITMPFSNDGKIAEMYPSYQFQAVIELRDSNNNQAIYNKNISFSIPHYGFGGIYDTNVFLFAGGFLMSGLFNNQLWANGVAPSSLVQDYLPGLVGPMNSNYQSGFYVVKKDDKPFDLSWQQWKDAVNLGAEFYDGDGDGVYNPKDKNYNGIWDRNEDMPALLGDVIAWCVYNDGKLPSQRRYQSDILGIEIRQTVFASRKSELKNTIFIKYNLQNTGLKSEILDSVYFGFWEDADIGEAYNDLLGCDTFLNSGFSFSNPDTITSFVGVYGINPPAFFTTLLQGPVVNTSDALDTAKLNYGKLIGTKTISEAKNLGTTSFVMFKGGDPLVGDPSSVKEVRYSQLALTRFGQAINPCDFAYGEVLGGVDCNQLNPKLWFSGDPVMRIGWLFKIPGDIRSLQSTGPFVLEKNKPIEIIVAYVVGRGDDHLSSITITRDHVRRALIEYENNFSSMTYQSGSPLYPVVDYKLYQNYPNPFNPGTTIRFEIPRDGFVSLKVFNVLGEEIATVLNEFRKSDRYEVDFDAPKLASGVYIYQIVSGDYISARKMMLVR